MKSEEINVQGDYNSVRTRTFMIQFEKCNPSTSAVSCKSETQIQDWLRDKYILTFKNQRRFDVEEFQKNHKIVEESRTNWIPINVDVKEEIALKVSRTELDLQDEIFQWGDMTIENIKNIFRVE